MSSSGCYGDSVEDYIRDTVELVSPQYAKWRPYFEVDIQRISDGLDEACSRADSWAAVSVEELAARFMDPSLPLWVRDAILKRVVQARVSGHTALFNCFIGEALQFLVEPRTSRLALVGLQDMIRRSPLAKRIFEGVEF